MGKRVAVTGLGCVSALGHDVRTFLRGLRVGQSAILPVERARGGDVARFPAALVPSYDPLRYFTGPELLLRDPFAQFALIAAREAVADAGLDCRDDPENTAIVFGTGGGGETSREEAAVQLLVERKGRCHPMLVPKTNSQAAVGLVSMEHGITGPSFTISTGCASSTHALAQALELVRHGKVARALAGGSEAAVLYSTMKGFSAVQALAPDTCRPFSVGRRGMVLGEGAGVLVLEDLELARARGARVYAELVGAGMSADACDPVQPTVDGPARAMRAALRDARLAPEAIGHVNAHGTGTLANDRAESAALRSVFGGNTGRLAVSATKSLHGHAFGGAGGIEAIATVLALHCGLIPPTANYLGADPECDLDCVPGASRRLEVEHALSNSFAFGGLNAVVAFSRTHDAVRPDLAAELGR
jgi:nodulation protein E